MPVFRNRVLALDIGSRRIKWLLYHTAGKRMVVIERGIKEIPPGWVKNGRLTDTEGVSTKLKEILEDIKGKVTKVSLSLACPEMIVRTVELPELSPKELKNAVRYEVGQLIPTGAGEYISDYSILEYIKRDGARYVRILLAVMPVSIMGEYSALFKGLGLTPHLFDFNGNCASRVINLMYHTKADKNVAVVDIGAALTTITIIEDGNPVFTRFVRFQNSSEENSGPENMQSIMPPVEQLLKDVYRTIEFYKSISKKTIDSIVLAGGGSCRKGISDYLAQGLGIKSIRMEAQQLPVSFNADFSSKHLAEFINVLGLAVTQANGKRKTLNLLPEKYRSAERKVKTAKAMAVILAVVVLTGSLVLPFFYVEKIKREATDLQNMLDRKDTITEYQNKREELAGLASERRRLVNMLETAGKDWPRIFVEIGRQTPGGIVLASMDYRDPEGLTITGEAADFRTAALFAVNLQRLDEISSAEPLSISLSENNTCLFEIRCIVGGEADEN
jgi:type IV pilus assembly protein PilM